LLGLINIFTPQEADRMQYVPAAHPENLKQLLKRSFWLYKTSFLKTLIFAFVLALITFTPRMLTLVLHKDIFFGLSLFHPLRLVLVVVDILGLIVFATLLERIRSVMDRTQETVGEDLGFSLKKIPLIFCASLVQTVIFTLMTFAIIGFYYFLHTQHLLVTTNLLKIFLITLPMVFQLFFNIYIFVLFIFYLPLIITENKGIFTSLGKSARLVWKNWWRTLKTQISPWVIYFITLILIRYALKINIHIYFLGQDELSWRVTIIQIILFTVFISWSAATLMVQLRDLERRKKALDTSKITP
jgi:hypothetical protein